MSLTINSYTQKPHTHSSQYTFSFSTYAESLIKRCVDFRERENLSMQNEIDWIKLPKTKNTKN